MSFSLYKEERCDGSKSSVKWTCPNIHDLKNILEKLDLDKILNRVCNKRLANLNELGVVQLRDECAKLNLSKKGKKVNTIVYVKEILNAKTVIKVIRSQLIIL